ncbi:MAG: hypothetical protein NXH73_01525 [Flavobacteriaceae bacterium]|nr:hypothetical protein [Flavobacteriaceae bacterium]
MKQKFRNFKHSKWPFILVLFVLFSCQTDDKPIDVNTGIEGVHQKTIKTVSASDVPEVMNFLKKANNNTLDFSISRSSETGVILDSREPDLILTDLETQQIQSLTGSSGKTNYTFMLKLQNAPEYPDEVSFFNLIVKEINTVEGFYSYIQEYRVDKQWYLNNDLSHDMSTYTGKMIFYNLEGLYLAKAGLNYGIVTESDTRHPCDDPINGDNPGGGGSSSGDGGPGPGGGSTGGTGSGGTGGSGITIVITPCTCEGHGPGENCVCEVGPTIEIIIRSMNNDGLSKNHLRHPCDEAPVLCFDEVDDTCECAEDGLSCVIEEEEVIITIPLTPCQKLNH